MQQRSVGATGLKVSRLGLGTMTWGRDTDEHEARDQLIAFVEAGGTLLDTAAGYGDGASEELIGTLLGDVVARDEVVLATKAGITRRTAAQRSYDASRGRLLADPRRLAAAARRRPRGPVAGAPVVRRHAARGDADARSTSRSRRGRASYVGVSNYSGWQTAQAATWQRAVPGRRAAGLDPGGVLPAQPGRRAGGVPAARGARARGAALVAAGPRGADRQVPHRHPVGLPRGVLALRQLRRAPTSTPARQQVVEAVARAADGPRLDAARGGAGLGPRPSRA